MSSDSRCSDAAISSRSDEFAFRLLFGLSSYDVISRIHISSCQSHINVSSIVRQTGGQTFLMFNPSFLQTLFQGGISYEHCYAKIEQLGNFLCVAFDDNESLLAAFETTHQMRADPTSPTDDKMIAKPAHLA